jgi:hypothetical protein
MKLKLAEINAAGGIVEYLKTDNGVCVHVGDGTAWIDTSEFDVLFTPLPEDESEGR